MNNTIDITSTSETNTNTQVHNHAISVVHLAESLNYQGTLSVGALEDSIRFYQQRTVEACLELGKCLILLKEMTPHGDFKQRIAMLNIHERTAQRFMSASYKFNKSDNLSLLKAVGNQSKLLELLVLDDEEIVELNEKGSIGDITLDDIDRMTASELRKALREAHANETAKDNIIKKKDEKLNELDAELTKLQSPAQIQQRAENEKQQLELSVLEHIQQSTLSLYKSVNQFINESQTIIETIEKHSLYNLQEQLENDVVAMFQQIANLSNTLSIQVNFEQMVTPSWLSEYQTEQSTTQDGTEE